MHIALAVHGIPLIPTVWVKRYADHLTDCLLNDSNPGRSDQAGQLVELSVKLSGLASCSGAVTHGVANWRCAFRLASRATP